jgi:hypothetical protein
MRQSREIYIILMESFCQRTDFQISHGQISLEIKLTLDRKRAKRHEFHIPAPFNDFDTFFLPSESDAVKSLLMIEEGSGT